MSSLSPSHNYNNDDAASAGNHCMRYYADSSHRVRAPGVAAHHRADANDAWGDSAEGKHTDSFAFGNEPASSTDRRHSGGQEQEHWSSAGNGAFVREREDAPGRNGRHHSRQITNQSDGEESGEYDEGDFAESGEEEDPWVQWFCGLRGNEFFCQVPIEYIQDQFNLYGLRRLVPDFFDYALDMILDLDTEESMRDLTEAEKEAIDESAETLYGLIHARFIVTGPGLHDMYKKYCRAEFGRCHRVFCEGQTMLPVGHSDVPGKCTVVCYCPKCREVYFPKSHRRGRIDGAFWGSTFASLFLMTNPEIVPKANYEMYVPRVFGFKIHKSSRYWGHDAEENNAKAQPAMSRKEQRKIRRHKRERERAERY